MAGRPQKKRKYTKRSERWNKSIEIPKTASEQTQKDTVTESFKFYEPNNGDLGRQDPPPITPVVPRASHNSFVFVDGCKVLIRNLPDEYLFNLNSDTLDKFASVQREFYSLQELIRNLENELSFRKL